MFADHSFTTVLTTYLQCVFSMFTGILSQRWRILFKMIITDQSKATAITRALCVLHNFLRTVGDTNYAPPGYTDSLAANGLINEGFWRTERNHLESETSTSRSINMDGTSVRELLCHHFNGAGSVPWQVELISRR